MGITRILVLFWALWAGGLQAGSVRYQVEGRTFEGYHLAGASQQSTLVLLVHDWDGLTGYEMKPTCWRPWVTGCLPPTCSALV